MPYPFLFSLPKQGAAAPVVLWHKSVNQSNSGCHTSGLKIKTLLNATSGIEV